MGVKLSKQLGADPSPTTTSVHKSPPPGGGANTPRGSPPPNLKRRPSIGINIYFFLQNSLDLM